MDPSWQRGVGQLASTSPSLSQPFLPPEASASQQRGSCHLGAATRGGRSPSARDTHSGEDVPLGLAALVPEKPWPEAWPYFCGHVSYLSFSSLTCEVGTPIPTASETVDGSLLTAPRGLAWAHLRPKAALGDAGHLPQARGPGTSHHCALTTDTLAGSPASKSQGRASRNLQAWVNLGEEAESGTGPAPALSLWVPATRGQAV